MERHNLHKMHDAYEQMLPGDLEHHIVQQVNNLSVFGRVVELFVPNALHTAARLIGGDANPQNPAGDEGRAPADADAWRRPPVR